jgi:hypothetical protein
MRFLFAILFSGLVVVASACTSSVQCECADFLPTVTMTVKDAATGNAIPNPLFTVNGDSPGPGQCIGVIPDDAGPDAGPNCLQWQLQLPVGHSVVTVAATGYQTQTFSYDTVMSGGCCKTGTQLAQTVSMSP